MRKYFLFLLTIILFSSCTRSCEEEFKDLYIVNNSDKTLFFMKGKHYPDTTIENNFNFWDSEGNRIYAVPSNSISPFETKKADVILHNSREQFYYRFDTLMIFLFDSSVIKNIPPETVEKDYLVLQRYDLSLQDLHKLHWKVYYPPTDAMKDMKMWPPYQESEDGD